MDLLCLLQIYLNKLILFDDSSVTETSELLDSLDYPNLEVYHSEENIGYGGTVNKAFAYATSDLVLVLNSDVIANNDFLSPLISAMQSNDKLGAINPAQKRTKKYAKYARKNGCVITYMLSGYAFLIRKEVFISTGMFDPVYGRG